MTLLDVPTYVCVWGIWNQSIWRTGKCCAMLLIPADWIRVVYMRMVWLGLETKPKTKQMVMNSCCLVVVKIFHAVWGRNLLVICVDVCFALLFYIIDFKQCISFLLSMLFCGTLNIWTLRTPTGWISKLILKYCRNHRRNSIAEPGLDLIVPKPWSFHFGSLSEKGFLEGESPKCKLEA